ncbi:MAG: prolipoprotein diacylglyceryl transferase [Anaerolineae bacterium]|nr:prolipoprotein diacylglyceryl transferase [Anaerolineae bacterium]
MPSFYTILGPLQIQTFTLVLALAVAISAGWAVYRTSGRPGPLVDTCLGGLIGGVISARLIHVLLNWPYFEYNTREIVRIHAGGLDWHGALLGGLIGLVAVARWRQVDFPRLLDALTPVLPLLMLAGWWGCHAANCAYGVEVDTLANYPPLVVAELPDVYGIPAPRYDTQLFGLICGLLAAALVVVLFWRGWLQGRRFWLILALLSLSMFAIGFYRSDYALSIAGLRDDQWLDLGVLIVSAAGTLRAKPG